MGSTSLFQLFFTIAFVLWLSARSVYSQVVNEDVHISISGSVAGANVVAKPILSEYGRNFVRLGQLDSSKIAVDFNDKKYLGQLPIEATLQFVFFKRRPVIVYEIVTNQLGYNTQVDTVLSSSKSLFVDLQVEKKDGTSPVIPIRVIGHFRLYSGNSSIKLNTETGDAWKLSESWGRRPGILGQAPLKKLVYSSIPFDERSPQKLGTEFSARFSIESDQNGLLLFDSATGDTWKLDDEKWKFIEQADQ